MSGNINLKAIQVNGTRFSGKGCSPGSVAIDKNAINSQFMVDGGTKMTLNGTCGKQTSSTNQMFNTSELSYKAFTTVPFSSDNGYSMFKDSCSSSPSSCNVANCQTCVSGSSTICQTCKGGIRPNKDGSCSSACSVAYCQTCVSGSSTQCATCNVGYGRVNNGTCRNCQIYNTTKTAVNKYGVTVQPGVTCRNMCGSDPNWDGRMIMDGSFNCENYKL